MSVFVVLSGFLMYYNYKESILDASVWGCLRFSAKKIRKLYPLHILTMIAALVFPVYSIFRSFTMEGVILNARNIILNILLLQDWLPNSSAYFSLNGVAWYLSLACFLYFAFPAILNRMKKIKSRRQVLLMAFFIYAAQIVVGLYCNHVKMQVSYIDNFGKWITYIFPIYRLGDFTIGCCFCYIFLHTKWKLKTITATICEVLVFVFIILSNYAVMNGIGLLGTEGMKYSVVYTVSSICFVYLFAQNDGLFSKVLTNRVVVYIGNISGYAFLIHQIVIRYLEMVLRYVTKQELNIFLFCISAFGITVVCAEIYIRMEKRFKKHNLPVKKLI